MFTEMLVKGIALDPLTSTHLVILKNKDESKSLTISIGVNEANAIISEIGSVSPVRPMTHDLLKNVIEFMGGEVKKIFITDLKHSTFYAVIELLKKGEPLEIDSRPSDAIALALRCGTPIMVSEEVLKKSKVVEALDEDGELNKWREFLENLSPSDFGKYTV